MVNRWVMIERRSRDRMVREKRTRRRNGDFDREFNY